MYKQLRNKTKRAIKREINHILGQKVACGARYNPDNNTWEIGMSVDFDIPEGLEMVKEGSDKDIQQKEVVAFMKEKEAEIISKLSERFKATYTHNIENDFNFTQPFPPMISTFVDMDGVPHLKTEEDKERIRTEFPNLVDMLEYDEKILKDGYFEFRGKDGVPEYEGFVLVKYGGLRARYSFVLPHQEEAVLS